MLTLEHKGQALLSLVGLVALACQGEARSDGVDRNRGAPSEDAATEPPDTGSLRDSAEPDAGGPRVDEPSPNPAPDATAPNGPPSVPPVDTGMAAVPETPSLPPAPDASTAPEGPVPTRTDAGASSGCPNADGCDAGSDEPIPPDPCVDGVDTRRCDGNVPEACEDGVWTSDRPCLDHCLQRTGWCVQCEPALEQCRGGLRYRCNVNGDWDSQGEDPACPCDEGDRACDPETRAERRCEGGVWVSETCEAGCATDGSGCLPNSSSEGGAVTCNTVTGTSCDGPCYFGYDPAVASCEPFSESIATIECDGPGDCPEGQECCHDDYALCGVMCVPAGDCRSNAYECHTGFDAHVVCDPGSPTDCTAEEMCTQVDFVDSRDLYVCR